MTLSNISSPGAVPIFQSLNTRFLESSSNTFVFLNHQKYKGVLFHLLIEFSSSHHLLSILHMLVYQKPLSACLICFKFPPVNPRLISVVIRNNSYNRSFSILIRTEKELIIEAATSGKRKQYCKLVYFHTICTN